MKASSLVWLLLLVAAVAAAPRPQVLVAKASQGIQLTVDGVATPARAAQMLVTTTPVEVTLKPGQELMLVFTSDGHQEILKGPGKFKIGAAGAQAHQGARVEKGKAVSRDGIAVRGSNLNRVGGGRQRVAKPEERYRIPDDIPIRRVAYKAGPDGQNLEVRFRGRGPGTFWVQVDHKDQLKHPRDEGVEALYNPGTEPGTWVTYFARVKVPEPHEKGLLLRVSWEDEESYKHQHFRYRLLDAEGEKTLEESMATIERLESPLARHLLSMVVYDDYDQLHSAIEHGRKALELLPDDKNLHADLIRLLLDAGRIEEARKHDQEVLRRFSD